MSNQLSVDDTEHLSDVPDGAGCTEIWERLSEERDEAQVDPFEGIIKNSRRSQGTFRLISLEEIDFPCS